MIVEQSWSEQIAKRPAARDAPPTAFLYVSSLNRQALALCTPVYTPPERKKLAKASCPAWSRTSSQLTPHTPPSPSSELCTNMTPSNPLSVSLVNMPESLRIR